MCASIGLKRVFNGLFIFLVTAACITSYLNTNVSWIEKTKMREGQNRQWGLLDVGKTSLFFFFFKGSQVLMDLLILPRAENDQNTHV